MLREKSRDRTHTKEGVFIKLLLCSLVMFLPVAVGASEVFDHEQDLGHKVAMLEEKLHRALHQGDFDQVMALLPEADHLESQLRKILEDPQRNARVKEKFLPLLEIIGELRRESDHFVTRRAWRHQRLPRIECSVDPKLISISTEDDGQAIIRGLPGAAGDMRARMVRIVNLSTADRVAALVKSNGAFEVKMFAPPSSWLQINTNMQRLEELGPEFEEILRFKGYVTPADLPHPEIFEEFFGGHLTSSPAIIIPVSPKSAFSKGKVSFVRKVGHDFWVFGNARASKTELLPGDFVDLEVTLSVVFGPKAENRRIPREPPAHGPGLHILFDKNGRQRSPGRQPISSVLTPTGLPIETHGEIVAEPRPDGKKEWNLGGTGLPVPWHWKEPGEWRKSEKLYTITQHLRVEIPPETPHGIYKLNSMLVGIGQEEFDTGEPLSGPPCLCFLKIGNPEAPKLSCVLLGSVGTDGSRGTIAQEDVEFFAFNSRIVFMPEKLVIPRDDAYTKKPWKYSLDPYIPILSMAGRPAPVIQKPLIPFDFSGSNLTVTITTPDGKIERLGPSPLAAGQNDLSVLRPDYVYPDRIIPPVRPTYGNPSPSDMYHLTGRGAFDYAFKKYGHYKIQLNGRINDMFGTKYDISGSYDVHVARPLDVDVFPEPGTPLEPNVELNPQVRILPAMPADVELRFRHYPYSDNKSIIERKIVGKANRWGIFVPGLNQQPIEFNDPGEYLCDVTVSHLTGSFCGCN
jgi:hypothetical protein